MIVDSIPIFCVRVCAQTLCLAKPTAEGSLGRDYPTFGSDLLFCDITSIVSYHWLLTQTIGNPIIVDKQRRNTLERNNIKITFLLLLVGYKKRIKLWFTWITSNRIFIYFLFVFEIKSNHLIKILFFSTILCPEQKLIIFPIFIQNDQFLSCILRWTMFILND